MTMRKYIAPVIAASITAILIAGLAIAQPGLGITKTAPLAGTGSSGNPLKITPCANGEVYQSNGTSWVCSAVAGGGGDITSVAAGIGLAGGGTTGAVSLSLLTSCADGYVLKSASSGSSWVCAADNDAGGDITSVGATSGMGLTGGASSGAALLGLLSTCTDGQTLESSASGTAWICADDDIGAPGAGDIESVAAGNGLTGGGTVGALTLDVACGTGLSCNANDVTLSLTGASCSAGNYVSAIGSTGTGTCTAEVGDISGVTASTGLSGGGTTGAVSLAVNIAGASCSAGQYVSAISATGTGTCTAEANVGDITSVVAGDGLTGGATSGAATVDVVCGSNLACAADSVNLATNVAVAGTLSVDGNATIGNAGSDTHIVNGAITNFVGTGTSTFVKEQTIGFNYADNASSTGYINLYGYAGGQTQYRNLIVSNGNGATIATFTGSSKEVDFYGPLVVTSGSNVFSADPSTNTTGVYGRMRDGGTAPTLSSCGSSPTVTGGSFGFLITVGTGSPGSCTFTFATSYTTTPSCIATTYGSTFVTYFSSLSATAGTLDINTTSFTDGQQVAVHCIGDQ
jgi:hypothetical protein